MGNRYEVSGGVTRHTDLTDKEVNGVIDHADGSVTGTKIADAPNGVSTSKINDGSVTDIKLASGVGLNDGQIAKLPVASQGQVLTRGATAWGAQTPSGGGSNSRVSAYLSANQTIPSGTATKVQLDTEVFDGNNEYDPTTNYRFTAANAGYYLVLANVLYYTYAANNLAQGMIYKNDSSIFQNTSHTGSTSGNLGISLSAVVYLEAGDYIEIYTLQNTGGTRTLYGGAGKTSLFIHRLS
jgi:hypothetical protein